MAIARTGTIVGAISGNLGGHTYANTKQGLVIKPRPLKITKQSPTLSRNRAIFKTVLALWAALTTQQRLEWRVFAQTQTRTNRLGVTSIPSAHNVFMTFNYTRLFHYGVAFTSPPAWTAPTILLAPTLTFTQGGPYTVTATVFELPLGTSVLVHGCRPMRNYPTHSFRTWSYIGRSQTEEFDIQTWWDQVLGPLVAGEFVTLRLYTAHFLAFVNLQSQLSTEVQAP